MERHNAAYTTIVLLLRAKVFVYDREQHVATFTYDWEKQQTEISIN